MDEELIGILAAAAGVADTEAAELATTAEGKAALKNKVAQKVAAIRKDADGRALRVATNAFKAIGVDAEVFEEGRDFKENLAAAAEAIRQQALADSGKSLTTEQALALPGVKQKLNELTASIDQKVTLARQEERQGFAQEKAQFAQEQATARKAVLADSELATLNPVFGDTAKAPGRRASLIEQLSKLPTVEVKGELFEADTNGELKTDALGNPVKYADMVRRETEALYDLPVSTDKSSPGVKQGEVVTEEPGFAFKEYQGALPKTKEDYIKLANDTTLPAAALKEVQAYWATQPSE